MRNSLSLNFLNDSIIVLSRCMCVRERGGGGGGGSSLFRRRSVWLKLLQSIHIKVKSETHIHNMTKIFFLYDCFSFNDLPYPLIQPTISTSHTGCKLISHMKENKGMVAMMLVLCSSNSPGHTNMGPLFEFHR